nr:hypothetical protein [Mesorhizobium huakuii]
MAGEIDANRPLYLPLPVVLAARVPAQADAYLDSAVARGEHVLADPDLEGACVLSIERERVCLFSQALTMARPAVIAAPP